MKKIFIILIAAFSLALTACDDKLDIDQKGVISVDDFYQTDEDAESALVTVYYMTGRFLSNSMMTTAGWNECPLLSMWSYASDDMFVAGQNKQDGQVGQEIQTYRHDLNNDVVEGTYEAYYIIVNQCNNLICNYEDRDDLTSTMNRCIAEARVIRAQIQLLLALAWGTPPIIDYAISGNDKPGNEESQEYELNWIVDECDKAIPYLDSKSSVSDAAGAVKVTKEYAYALKGKTLLFLKDYSGAKTALAEVIDSGLYDLVPSDQMASLNHNSGKASTEAVFELSFNYDASLSTYYRTQPNFRYLWNWRADQMVTNGPTGEGSEYTGIGWGWCNPSAKFVEAILEHDGMDSARRKAWIKSYDEVLYDMPWLSDAEGLDETTDQQRGTDDGFYGHVGYFQWKRLFRTEDQISYDGNVADWNLTVMRYAEVLLLYAEACAMLGETSGKGLEALQAVNERAESQTAITTLSMDNVKIEKYLENWLDGTRFQDLVRWGDAYEELKDSGTYYPNFYDAMFTQNETVHRGYIDESDADWATKLYDCGFKEGKHELFPFPYCEIQVNPNIVQNPGY